MEVTTINVKIVIFEFPYGSSVDNSATSATEFGLEAKVDPGEDLKAAYKIAYLSLLDTIYSPVTASSSSNLDTREWRKEWGEKRKQQQSEALALQREQEDAEQKRIEEREFVESERRRKEKERQNVENSEKMAEERFRKAYQQHESTMREIAEWRRLNGYGPSEQLEGETQESKRAHQNVAKSEREADERFQRASQQYESSKREIEEWRQANDK